MQAELISSEYLNRHPYFTARRDAYRMASGKMVDPYFVVEIPVSVVVMAVTEQQQVILVKQYRHPLGETMLELPGGFIDDGETPHAAAQRELLEETGYRVEQFQFLGTTAANPGVLNNVTHMYLALDGVKVKEQQLDPNEEIEILVKPLEEVRMLLQQHGFRQSMHALCIFYALAWMDQQAK